MTEYFCIAAFIIGLAIGAMATLYLYVVEKPYEKEEETIKDYKEWNKGFNSGWDKGWDSGYKYAIDMAIDIVEQTNENKQCEDKEVNNNDN